MAPDPPSSTPATHVTLVSDTVAIPPFSGNGSESVHAFVRRVNDECTRRSAAADAEKLAILKSRICYEPSSIAGKLVKSDKFLSFTTYDTFTAALITHFAGHSKLGATHSFLKVAQTLTHITRSTSDVYKAENVASSLSSEITDQLKPSQWIDDDGKITANDFQRLMSYFIFILQLDAPTFSVASDIELKKTDFLYDVCVKISEKSPPVAQPVSIVHHPQSTMQQSVGASNSYRGPSPSRSRSHSRSYHNNRQRYRSPSRNSRNVTCHRCGLKGHTQPECRVVLNDQGQSTYDPNAFCTLHNRRGHTLTNCRLHQLRLSSGSPQRSGNASRPTSPQAT